jgi:hypothetical protein
LGYGMGKIVGAELDNDTVPVILYRLQANAEPVCARLAAFSVGCELQKLQLQKR